MPNLLDGITLIIDFLVAPATMVWFVVRWYRLVPNDNNHAKALKATRQGYSAGLAAAVLLLLGFHYFNPQPAEGKLSVFGLGSALVFGLFAGMLPSLTKKLAPTSDGQDQSESWKHFPVVAAATALGLAALVLYFAYWGKYFVHQWLMFAFVTILCVSRLSLIFGE